MGPRFLDQSAVTICMGILGSIVLPMYMWVSSRFCGFLQIHINIMLQKLAPKCKSLCKMTCDRLAHHPRFNHTLRLVFSRKPLDLQYYNLDHWRWISVWTYSSIRLIQQYMGSTTMHVIMYNTLIKTRTRTCAVMDKDCLKTSTTHQACVLWPIKTRK